MESRTLALFLTFLLGLFIVVGAVLAFFLQKKSKVLDFILALALSLLLMLLFFDLLPEIMESLHLNKIWLFLIFAIVGILCFKVLDHFVPEHHDHKMTKKEAKRNMLHIGTLTTLALMLHNVMEGMAIYFVAEKDLSLGVMMSLGIGLHNVPLGMIISSAFYQSEEKTTMTFFYLFLLTISTFVGGLIPFLFHLQKISDLVMGALLSLTFGMLSYISIFELYPRVRESKNKRVSICGILVGVLLILSTLFFE